MRPTLQFRLSQQLSLTPQLQMAIKLLQLSTVELCQEIQQAIETNPLLELQELNEEETDNLEVTDESLNEGTNSSLDLQNNETIPTELPIDTAWEDIYDDANHNRSSSELTSSAIEWQTNSDDQALREHLLWQVQLSHLSEVDQAIATAIIDSIDDNGFLYNSLEDIRAGLHMPVTLAEIEVVLHYIQNLEPAGVGARNLKECLLIQLRQLPKDTPWLHEAREVILHHLDKLANHNYQPILKQYMLSHTQLQEIIKLIQSLNPRPGSLISNSSTSYVVPDVLVTKKNNQWFVELNPEAIPRLRINHHYASLIQHVKTSSDNFSFRHNLQEARWFIKSIQNRHETLLKVATFIVEHQRPFLEYGAEGMRPLVLRDVADALGMHESTISRITTQKYIHTPQGIFELKYFFSNHLTTSDGQECSATAIRAFIKKLISAENSNKPLSDNSIAKYLHEHGIHVARRTITKYREAMAIPSAHKRKSLHQYS